MLLFTTLLVSLLSSVTAQTSSANSSSSVFVLDGQDGTSLTFALQAVKSTGDLYFHLSAPAGNNWVGVGIGYQMANSLMFIAYANGSGGITISPRIATGETEPMYQDDIEIEYTGTNAVTGSGNEQSIVANGICKACAKVMGVNNIDLTSSAQPFIFAVGPPFPPLASTSQSAGLTEHSYVGHFTMDMSAATVQSGGQVPSGPFTTSKSASAATNTQAINDPAPHIHGLIMCFVFVFLFPIGTLILRVWDSVRYHAVLQCVALVLFCMAFAGGIVVSTKYVRSKHFDSAHQIIGILLLVALLSQLTMGIINHRVFKREQRKTIFGRIHLYLGPAIIFFGLINGGLGFSLAQSGFLAIPYTIIIIIVAVLYSCIRVFSWRRRKRQGGLKEQVVAEGYQYPRFGPPQPPTYGEFESQSSPAAYRSQDVPLERYHSSQSVPQLGMPAVEPRQMI